MQDEGDDGSDGSVGTVVEGRAVKKQQGADRCPYVQQRVLVNSIEDYFAEVNCVQEHEGNMDDDGSDAAHENDKGNGSA